jgi:hypothetical protein
MWREPMCQEWSMENEVEIVGSKEVDQEMVFR